MLLNYTVVTEIGADATQSKDSAALTKCLARG